MALNSQFRDLFARSCSNFRHSGNARKILYHSLSANRLNSRRLKPMQWTGKRIVTIVMVVGTVITTYQLLSKPQPVAVPQNAETARANAQSFDQKLEQLQAPRSAGSAPAEVRFSSEEVS